MLNDRQSALPWQQTSWLRMVTAMREQRLSHAYLLAGAAGIGKQVFARAFAGLRLCQQPQNDAACGQCKACKLFSAGTHPDFLEIAPESASGALKIDQIRRVSDFVQSTASYEGSARVVLLYPAESLGSGAANALLKSLEEPPGDSLFLLLTHLPGSVLATVRSRCQAMQMPQPEAVQALQWLIEIEGDTEQSRHAATLAPGQPLLALDYIHQGLPVLYQKLEAAVESLPTDRANALGLATECREFGPGPVLTFVQHYTAGKIRKLMTTDQATAGQSNVQKTGLRNLFTFFAELEQYQKEVNSSANPNPQLTLETLFLRWREVLLQCP